MLCFSDVKHINTFIINNIVTNAGALQEPAMDPVNFPYYG